MCNGHEWQVDFPKTFWQGIFNDLKKNFPTNSSKHVKATGDHGGFVFIQLLGSRIAYLLYTHQMPWASGKWQAADLEVKSFVSSYISLSHAVWSASSFIGAVNHKYPRQIM